MSASLRLLVLLGTLACAAAVAEPRRVPLNVRPGDVLATGNEWLALPEIRTSDGALVTFNVLSMRERGLLQASGESGRPVLEPYLKVGAKRQALDALNWSLLEPTPGRYNRTYQLTADRRAAALAKRDRVRKAIEDTHHRQ